ncbi:MAG: CdaR family protein [Firmicutes bacterium]|nr:CdaR family protein [Bacillota bacterium]
MDKKTRNNSIFQNRILWGIVSLLAALVVWFIVNAQSVTDTANIVDVQVTFHGEPQLNDLGLVITNVATNKVNLRLTGPQRELAKLSADNLSVSVDVTDITEPQDGLNRPATVIFPSEVDSTKITGTTSPAGIVFSVERQISKDVEVRGAFTGTTADGFKPDGKITFDPAAITISGPQSAVNKVSYAWVNLSQKDVDATLAQDTAYVLNDANDRPVDDTVLNDLKLDPISVHATLPVTAVKTVRLTLDVSPGGGATAANANIQIVPETVELAGDPVILQGIDSLTIGSVDLATIATESSFTVNDIPIPEGLRNFSGTMSADVSVKITGLTTRSFNVTNISVINLPPNVDWQIGGEGVNVTVRGDPEAVNAMTAGDISATADLAVADGPGQWTVSLTWNLDVSGPGVIGGPYNVTVTLTATTP